MTGSPLLKQLDSDNEATAFASLQCANREFREHNEARFSRLPQM